MGRKEIGDNLSLVSLMPDLLMWIRSSGLICSLGYYKVVKEPNKICGA